MELQEKVIRMVSAILQVPRGDISPSSELAELAKDSIQLFELVMAFEAEFKAHASYEDLIKIETVADIISYINKKAVSNAPVS